MNTELKYRYPIISNIYVRYLLDIIFLNLLYFFVYDSDFPETAIFSLLSIFLMSGLYFFTHRHIDKYPQRHITFLLANLFKGLFVGCFVLYFFSSFPIFSFISLHEVLLLNLSLFCFDLMLCYPYSSSNSLKVSAYTETFGEDFLHSKEENLSSYIPKANLRELKLSLSRILPSPVLEEIQNYFIDDATNKINYEIISEENLKISSKNNLLIVSESLNRINRLNIFLENLSTQLEESNSIIVNFTPMEEHLSSKKKNLNNFCFLLYYIYYFVLVRSLPKIPFLDKLYFFGPFKLLDFLKNILFGKRNRALSRAEAMGRMVFYGFEILSEVNINGQYFLISRKTNNKINNSAPSYYPIIKLKKVGVNYEIFNLYKVRSMYPFSEFLQESIYKKSGLTNQGKFKDDFRLTDYSIKLRKYWLDEIPGLLNWLRGDIKLVGMRATSPHFLNLYPESLLKFYKLVKPGLIPPIFDKKISGFDDIVKIEMNYLQSYVANPFSTDFRYFFITLKDIFINKVRSN